MLRSKKRVNPSAGRAREEAQTKEIVRKSIPSILLTCVALVLTPSFFLTPEGAIREGDSLPCVLLFLLLFLIALWWNYWSHSRSRRSPEERSVVDSHDHIEKRRIVLTRSADIALGFYLLLATSAYLRVVFFRTADVRLSTNAYWSFVTPVLFYFFIRIFPQIFTRRATVALCSLLVAYSFAESAFSLYSYAVITPQSQAAYRANPDKVLKESGFDFPEGSAERLLFEKRLLESTEPTGTYGLANTLGAVIAPTFLIALLGFPWWKLLRDAFRCETSRRGTYLFSGLVWLFGLTLTVVVLIATKSRASVLAVAIGLAVWLALNIVESYRQNIKRTKIFLVWGVVLFCAFALAVSGAFALGVLDREVFTEAGKSLGYRLDYWRATSAMIGDHPLLGIGPGEFQSAYARYILPTASEFIADPHNFVFEIAALFGTPALIAFLTFLAFAVVVGLLDICQLRHIPTPPSNACERTELLAEVGSERVYSALTWGAALGVVATLALSMLHSAPLAWRFYPVIVLPIALTLVATYAMTSSTTNQDLRNACIPVKVVLASLATLLVNLCVAGGFGYLSISIPLFGLLAILLNGVEVKRASDSRPYLGSKASLSLSLATLGAVALFYYTAFIPRNASFLISSSSSPNRETIAALESGDVAKIDKYSSSVAQQSYFYAGIKYLKAPTTENKKQWDSLRELVKINAPNSAPIRETCANFDWSLFQQNQTRVEFGESALALYREAVALSPTDVRKREKLARALILLKQDDDALREVELTLHYDSVNPHEDRKLSEENRRELQAFIEKSKR